MAQFEVGNIVQITMVGRLHRQTILNVFNYRIAASTVAPQPGPVADEIANRFFANTHLKVLARLSQEYEAVEIRVQDVYPIRWVHRAYIPQLGSNQQGAIATSALPTSVAVVTTLASALAGESHRGRKFWAGLPVTAEDDSLVEAVSLASWRGSVDPDLIADISFALDTINYSFVPVIWSLQDPTGVDDIESALTQPVLRTQRRRQVQRGV
jgi:hypothetical protein